MKKKRVYDPETEKILEIPEEASMDHTADLVNHPAHYTQGGVECIDALKAATVGLIGIEAVCTANAIKYLWRWKQKDGIRDLRKAVWYINRLIAEMTEAMIDKGIEEAKKHG